MDLHSDYPFWLIKEGVLRSFPALSNDLDTDVLVIGGGITGALVARELTRRHVRTVVVDKRHIGFGSTSASTALVQYEIDKPMHVLGARIGERRAVRAFRLCVDAIDKLESLCGRLDGKAGFRRQPSLWYASYKRDVGKIIQPEFRARKKHGFDVRLLDERDLRTTFGFSAPAAILSEAGATCNPYQLTSGLLGEVVSAGGKVYDLTKVAGWSVARRHVDIVTAAGHRIRAKFVVVAAGYESQAYLSKLVTQFHSTYALASKPGSRSEPWHRGSMLWETKRPYLYARTTPDGRIIIGGRDENFSSPRKRDALIRQKSRLLRADFAKRFPHVAFDLDFAWAGTFGETRDGLPYIGAADSPRVLYAMGYGGNGITFSVVAANVISDAVTRRKNVDAAIFAFNR